MAQPPVRMGRCVEFKRRSGKMCRYKVPSFTVINSQNRYLFHGIASNVWWRCAYSGVYSECGSRACSAGGNPSSRDNTPEWLFSMASLGCEARAYPGPNAIENGECGKFMPKRSEGFLMESGELRGCSYRFGQYCGCAVIRALHNQDGIHVWAARINLVWNAEWQGLWKPSGPGMRQFAIN